MIRILATGGTFDVDSIDEGDVYYFQESYVPKILAQCRNMAKVTVETLFLKDSLYITDADRQQVSQRTFECDEQFIVITHGTDTMVQTAISLAQNKTAKTVVLTGAIVPYMALESDATFNLGFALAAVQLLAPGIYIAMNGKVFMWNNVRKNQDLKVFEELN
jgi:L-asparaginase